MPCKHLLTGIIGNKALYIVGFLKKGQMKVFKTSDPNIYSLLQPMSSNVHKCKPAHNACHTFHDNDMIAIIANLMVCRCHVLAGVFLRELIISNFYMINNRCANEAQLVNIPT